MNQYRAKPAMSVISVIPALGRLGHEHCEIECEGSLGCPVRKPSVDEGSGSGGCLKVVLGGMREEHA